MRLAIIALAASTAAIATAAIAAREQANLSPAPPAGTGLPSGQCLRTQEIRGHTVADNKTLLLAVRGKDTYRVTMVGSCLAGATTSDAIITRSPPGSPIICKPIDFDLAIDRDGFESRCIVDFIVKMSPEEVATLPRRLKP